MLTGITVQAEKLRLNYAVQLQNSPRSRGVIIVYAGSPWTVKAAKLRGRRAVAYLVQKRGVSADRLEWKYEGSCAQGSVLLYLLYPNETNPAPDPDCKRGQTPDVHGEVTIGRTEQALATARNQGVFQRTTCRVSINRTVVARPLKRSVPRHLVFGEGE